MVEPIWTRSTLQHLAKLVDFLEISNYKSHCPPRLHSAGDKPRPKCDLMMIKYRMERLVAADDGADLDLEHSPASG